MALIVIFDVGATPQKVLEVIPSANTPDYDKRSDVVVNPDLSALDLINRKYWKHDTGLIVEMTAGEKTAQDTADQAQATADRRVSAEAAVDGQEDSERVMRAFMILVKEQFNVLRALHSLPDLTTAPLKTAIKNKISSGDED